MMNSMFADAPFETVLPLQPGITQHFDHYMEYLADSRDGLPILYYQFHVPLKHSGFCPLLPGGCIDILFPYGGQPAVSLVYGSVRSRSELLLQPGTSYFAVRLLPVALAPIAQIPLKELVDHSVPLQALLSFARCLELRIQSRALSFRERITAFQEEMNCLTQPSQRRHESEPKELLPAVRQIYLAHGNLSLAELSRMMNRSTRHVRYVFEEFIGLPPKTFCRIVRFQQAVSRLLQPGRTVFNDIISESGYYDQAHFIREFKTFVRECPTLFLANHFKRL